ncbi:serine carboxypeptidase-like 45 [Castanea sativa]|uniref:serine carboxypeptidase-like 45 n=1 Tax=Castanea sativa TaxID=21020 RepID=UPI003F64FB7A
MGSPPLFDFASDFDGEDEFYWSRGLISNASYKLLTTVCSSSNLLSQALRGNLSEDCDRVNTQVSKELTLSIDKNNVLGVIWTQESITIRKTKSEDKFKISTSSVSSSTDPCLQRKIGAYLNRTDVQKALHAKLVGITQWTICSRVLNYNLVDLEVTTTQLFGSFVKSGIWTLVYSGDVDGSIPFTGTRTLIDGLGKDLGLSVTVPHRPWFEGKQVGGWTQVYGDILVFVLVRGGGHQTPATQPERSLSMLKAYLEGKPLPDS